MYVVICQDEGKWILTTRRLFTKENAAIYTRGIAPGRHPMILPIKDFMLWLPRCMEVKAPLTIPN